MIISLPHESSPGGFWKRTVFVVAVCSMSVHEEFNWHIINSMHLIKLYVAVLENDLSEEIFLKEKQVKLMSNTICSQPN